MATDIPSKVLLIDPDEANMGSLEGILKKNKVAVEKAKDWEAAQYLFNTQKFEAAIVALDVDGMSGTTLIQKWRKHEVVLKRHCAFILTSGVKRSKEDELLVKEIGDVPLLTHPINPAILMGLIASALKLARQTAAIEQVDNTLIKPLLKGEKYEKAMQVAKEKLEPIGPKGKFLSATIHKDYEITHSIKLVKNLANDDPENMKYRNELGSLLLFSGNFSEAQNVFEEADKLAPKQIDRMNSLANIYLATGQGDKATEKFRDLIKMNPDQPELKFEYFEKLLDHNMDENAQNLFNETSSGEELMRHYNNQGVMKSKLGDKAGALLEYGKALRLIGGRKDSYKVLFNMALARLNMGSKEDVLEAAKLLKKCLELNPSYDKAKSTLERLNQAISSGQHSE